MKNGLLDICARVPSPVVFGARTAGSGFWLVEPLKDSIDLDVDAGTASLSMPKTYQLSMDSFSGMGDEYEYEGNLRTRRNLTLSIRGAIIPPTLSSFTS